MEKIKNSIQILSLETQSIEPCRVELWPNVSRTLVLGSSNCDKTNAKRKKFQVHHVKEDPSNPQNPSKTENPLFGH